MLLPSIIVSIFLLSITIFGQDDYCPWIKCENGGRCINKQFENKTIYFECQCPLGFNGTLCENKINITMCVKNPCLNSGICSISKNRTLQIHCQCPQQFTGEFCETFIPK